ncbi:WD40 repeat domain-containing protein [Nostoc sp.]|uniref:WD40 repeat domain-containing protein n=1 Tax=Nostoc sp. TaxID=1180 RepID=UPI002FFD0E46
MTVNNTVLGGIERVKQLLAYGKVEQKIDALINAFEYGEAGLNLIIEALQNSEVDVQEAAYWLLQESTEPRAKLALQAYSPYLFFEYLFTIERYTNEVRSIACVDISQELQTLVTCNYNKIIQVWNMQTQQVICTFQPETTKEFDQIAIAPNNRVLGLWHCLDLAEVWDLKIGQKIFTTNIQSEEFWGVSFSPDGQALVSTRDGYKLTFWDINEQKIIPSIFIPENIPRRIPIYSNSQILVTEEQGFDQNYEIWDWQTQQVICTLSLSGYMPVITVSRDQRFLLSGSRENGIIKVWNIRTGHELCSLTSHSSSITRLAISSNGQRLFIWSGDSTVEVWGI